MSKHFLPKALIQLPRNTEDNAVAHFNSYFAFFITVQSILYGESSQN